MAYEGAQDRLVGVTASADLRTHQYKAVKISGNNTVTVCAAVTDIPVGILQNTPNTGQAAEVCVAGVTKINADAALTAGQVIGSSADGQLAPYVAGTDTTKYSVGQVLSPAGAAGELATAIVSCAQPSRLA